MVRADQDVGRAAAGLEPAVSLLAGRGTAKKMLVGAASRQLKSELHAGNSAPAEPLPPATDPDVTEPSGLGDAELGVAGRDREVRAIDCRDLKVDSLDTVELEVERRRDIVVVGVALDPRSAGSAIAERSTPTRPSCRRVCGTSS